MREIEYVLQYRLKKNSLHDKALCTFHIWTDYRTDLDAKITFFKFDKKSVNSLSELQLLCSRGSFDKDAFQIVFKNNISEFITDQYNFRVIKKGYKVKFSF